MISKFFLAIFVVIKMTELTNQLSDGKPVYEYRFKVWINDDFVSTYGGQGRESEKRSRVEFLIKQQWLNVNDYFNRQNSFQSRFNFLPYRFDYFQDYPNETHMGNIDFNIPLPEENCDYRVIYSHSSYNRYIHSDYFNRSIRFSINPESEWNETIWDQYSTRILSHELAHSRGAYDLYSVNVNGNQNQVFYGVGYSYPVGSVMNYLYDLSTHFDEHSLYVINQHAGQLITPTLSSEMFWSLFPSKFGVHVKDMLNNPIQNLSVVFYGVRWLEEGVNVNDKFDKNTDNYGKVTFHGNDSTNNPYQRSGPGSLGTFSNFLVVVYNQRDSLLNWLPVFLVQTAKIENKTEYYIDFQFNLKPNIEFLYPLTNSFNLTVPQFANSFDFSCQVHYALVVKMNLSVHAWDIDGNITKVEFYCNDQLMTEVSVPPYVFEWYISNDGTYHIMAKAYDNLNGVSQSKTMIVNVSSEESGIDTAMIMIENDQCLV